MNRADGTGSALPACQARGLDTMQAILVQGPGSLVKGMGLEPVRADYTQSGELMSLYAANNMGLESVRADYAQESGESGYWTYHDSRSAD